MKREAIFEVVTGALHCSEAGYMLIWREVNGYEG
jgi:hypothetical protein